MPSPLRISPGTQDAATNPGSASIDPTAGYLGATPCTCKQPVQRMLSRPDLYWCFCVELQRDPRHSSLQHGSSHFIFPLGLISSILASISSGLSCIFNPFNRFLSTRAAELSAPVQHSSQSAIARHCCVKELFLASDCPSVSRILPCFCSQGVYWQGYACGNAETDPQACCTLPDDGK